MKKIIIVLVALMSVVASFGQEVSEATAMQRALEFINKSDGKPKKFLSGKQATSADIKHAYTSTGEKGSNFFVYNVGNSNGFVLVSGDERIAPILGYSDTGSFDIEKVPCNMKWLLDNYAKQISVLRNYYPTNVSSPIISTNAKKNTTTNTDFPASCAPLLGDIQWGQDAPYNALCPEVNGKTCPTGCVATAMAQIMRYHKWPEHGTGSHEYTTETYGLLQSADFSSHSYDWDNMLPNYFGESTSEQQTAVATLMHDIGVSVEMDYTGYTSGAFMGEVRHALFSHFGYDGGMTRIFRTGYESEEWEYIIKKEIAEHRPVLLGGVAVDKSHFAILSHAFVADGYNEDGSFHINWGWNGNFDGNYLFDLLIPSYTDIPNFADYGLEAIINIQPKCTEKELSYDVYVENMFLIGDDEIYISKISHDLPEGQKVVLHFNAYRDGHLVHSSDFMYLNNIPNYYDVSSFNYVGIFDRCGDLPDWYNVGDKLYLQFNDTEGHVKDVIHGIDCPVFFEIAEDNGKIFLVPHYEEGYEQPQREIGESWVKVYDNRGNDHFFPTDMYSTVKGSGGMMTSIYFGDYVPETFYLNPYHNNITYVFDRDYNFYTNVIESMNIVYGNPAKCKKFVLGNEYFYTAKPFYSECSQYVRHFQFPDYNTFVVPFNVSKITNKDTGEEIDWRSENAKIWIGEFIDADDDCVYFDQSLDICANTPYMIKVLDQTLNYVNLVFHGSEEGENIDNFECKTIVHGNYEFIASYKKQDAIPNLYTIRMGNMSPFFGYDGKTFLRPFEPAIRSLGEDKGWGARVYIVIGKKPSIPVSSINLDKTSASVIIGETLVLSATVNPSNATDKSLTWNSSNTNVATVSSEGVVTAVSVGTATITATSIDGSGTSASCNITVLPDRYKLVYLIDDIVYYESMVKVGADITPIDAPSKDDYTFYRWDGMPEDLIMPSHDLIVSAVYAIRGDVNFDQRVNITDAVDIVNDRLGYESIGFVYDLSDVNRDDMYTITDAIGVINIIYGEPVSYAPHRKGASYESLDLSLTNNNTVELVMNCANGYTAFQFNVQLPEGVELDAITLNENKCKDFAVRFNKVNDNIYKVVAYNLANEPLANGSDNLLTMNISGANESDEIRLTNIHFSTKKAVDVMFEDMALNMTTGILSHAVPGDVVGYNIAGLRVNKDYRGIVIVNGKKVIRK